MTPEDTYEVIGTCQLEGDKWVVRSSWIDGGSAALPCEPWGWLGFTPYVERKLSE